jgi:hypothetical protein
MSTSVILYGPQGSGKMFHAPKIAKHYGLSKIVDEWRGMDPVEPEGVLYVTNDPLSATAWSFGVRVLSIAEARNEVERST